MAPSATIRGEWNVLLNPKHHEFGKIRFRTLCRLSNLTNDVRVILLLRARWDEGTLKC